MSGPEETLPDAGHLSERGAYLVLALFLIPLATAFAWWTFLPNDDTYIFLVYVKNVLSGNGLTYNGERVEGFSSVLWTAILTIAGLTRAPLPITAEVLSALFGLGSLLALYQLGRTVGLSPAKALLPPLLTAGTGDCAFYMSSGMETSLFTLLYLCGLQIAQGKPADQALRSVSLPLFLTLATLTRPEGALLAVVLLAYLGFACQSPGAALRCGVTMILLMFPVLLIKQQYYGEWLPNTYYAKIAGLGNLAHGIEYARATAPRYLVVLIPYVALLVYNLANRDWLTLRLALLPSMMWMMWSVYVVVRGGDTLVGARAFVPVIPLFHLSLIALARRIPSRISAPAAAIASVALAVGFTMDERVNVVKRSWRAAYPVRVQVGRYLHDHFPPDTLVVTNAAGIIPFYSELPTIDSLGLNNKYIAHYGHRDLSMPFGHQIGDGDYVMSLHPDVILFGSRGTKDPYHLVGDQEIWKNKEFQANYEPRPLVAGAFAYVKKEEHPVSNLIPSGAAVDLPSSKGYP